MNEFATFWNVDRPPFQRPVDVNTPFIPSRIKNALDRLHLVTQQGLPLALITGEPGAGKSFLLRWLFHSLDNRTHEALVTTLMRREKSAGWLTPRLANLFGVEPHENVSDQIRVVAAKMDLLAQEKKRLMIAVDQAHLLAEKDAFEEMTSYLNLHSLGDGTLSFVLAGTSDLASVVAETPSLKARLAYHLELPNLTRDELAQYVAFRLRLANLQPSTFDDAALDLLHVQTRGIYAAINVQADACLIEAFQRRTKRVTADVLRAAGDQSPRTSYSDAPQPTLTTAPPTAEPKPETPPRPETSASIRLSSLFKSGPKEPKG